MIKHKVTRETIMQFCRTHHANTLKENEQPTEELSQLAYYETIVLVDVDVETNRLTLREEDMKESNHNLPEDFYLDNLQYWASFTSHQGTISRYYVNENGEIWVTFVTNGSSKGYSLGRALEDTYLCECNTCKDKYVINAAESRWYFSKDLKLPNNCLPCRQRRKANRINSN